MSELLPPAEWNHTDRHYPGALLHESFAAQVARDPAAPAVRFRDEALSYGQLDQRVEELARHLVAMGVVPDMLVAVCMERSIEMVVALHAVLRAGGAYVPLDPEYPDERIELLLRDLDDPIVLTQHHLIERLTGVGARAIATDLPLVEPREPVTTRPRPVGPDDLAYALYTSGSTGQPKGALFTQRGIANCIAWLQDHFELTPEDKVLQKTPFTFDVSLWELFWPLLVGAELVIAEPGAHGDSAYLSQTIVEQGITTINFVPSMLQLFLEDPRAGECVSLRHVICAGEALSRALQDRFFARLDAGLHILYGPTEANVVSVWVCDPGSPLPFVPIGKPIANTQLYILDTDMRPIHVGEVGELFIGGVQVGRGYLKRPELSAERFIPDPFRPGGTLYKTGDLARYLPNGNIEFLGRRDFQVKVRGFRVELGEVEATLESIDGVRGAVVVAHERSAGEVELVAYVAHPEGDQLPIEELRVRLGDRLPEYMVPTTIIALDQFPLNANGKVDRKALPSPVRTRPLLGTPYVPPRTPLQRDLVERWRRILDIDRVGIDDRFFELGGTSLKAARFVNQMQTALGETIFVVTLFGAPSVTEYAAFLERQFPASVARLLTGPGLVIPVSEPGATSTGMHAGRVPTTASSPRGPAAAGAERRSASDARSTRSRDSLTQQLERRRAARSR